MGFSADEVDRIVAAIRDGSFSAVLGGSRLHYTFLGRGGELFLEDFDEGATSERSSEIPYLERQIARLIEQKHLAAILAAPGDDTPRLVWADALSDRGNLRGELIVTQCRAARLDRDDPERSALEARARQLIVLHGRDWAQRGQGFGRGMVTSAQIRWMGFEAESNALFVANPLLRELHFVAYPHDAMDRPQSILEDPRVARLPALDLSDPYFHAPDATTGEELITAAFGSSLVDAMEDRLPELEELTFARAFLRPEDVTRPGLRPGLRKLDLSGNAMAGFGEALFQASGLQNLRDLTLARCELSDSDLGGLARLRALESLDLSSNRIGRETLGRLTSLPLRHLHLSLERWKTTRCRCWRGSRCRRSRSGTTRSTKRAWPRSCVVASGERSGAFASAIATSLASDRPSRVSSPTCRSCGSSISAAAPSMAMVPSRCSRRSHRCGGFVSASARSATPGWRSSSRIPRSNGSRCSSWITTAWGPRRARSSRGLRGFRSICTSVTILLPANTTTWNTKLVFDGDAAYQSTMAEKTYNH